MDDVHVAAPSPLEKQILEGYCRWLSDRRWWHGYTCFADGTEAEVRQVACKMSRIREVMFRKMKFKGTPVHLLYVAPLEFPFVPALYWYICIDETDGPMLRMADARSVYLKLETVVLISARRETTPSDE